MSSQDIQNFSSSQGEGRDGGASEGYKNDEKGGSDVGKGAHEYRKGMGGEVRCRVWERAEGAGVGAQWVEMHTGREGSVKE